MTTSPFPSPDGLRVISYGGGVQSTALVVLAATGRLGHVDAALFCNVGDECEHPATLDYVRDIAMPWAEDRGLEVLELRRHRRDGSPESLWDRLTNPESSNPPIPVRLASGAPASRSCTADFKVRVVSKWLREHGATEENPASVLIGISTDEIQRLNNRRQSTHEVSEYPLIDVRYDRQDCVNIIREAGLPVPPKSACWFCPFHRRQVWAEMRRDEPDLFWRSVELERSINVRRAAASKPDVFLTDRMVPLDVAIDEAQTPLFLDGPAGCDSGYCWT